MVTWSSFPALPKTTANARINANQRIRPNTHYENVATCITSGTVAISSYEIIAIPIVIFTIAPTVNLYCYY